MANSPMAQPCVVDGSLVTNQPVLEKGFSVIAVVYPVEDRPYGLLDRRAPLRRVSMMLVAPALGLGEVQIFSNFARWVLRL
jgi:hypothetical protein